MAINHLNKITDLIIGSAIEVHKALGPGMLESAYQKCMVYELREMGLHIQSEVPVPVIYKEIELDYGYKIDLLVEDAVIVELKSVEHLTKVHEAQILTYMKFANKPVGLLINFNNLLLKNGVRRFVM